MHPGHSADDKKESNLNDSLNHPLYVINSDNEKNNHTTDKPADVWLDKQDVLQRMHISDRTLQTWRSKKLLRYSKIGGKIYYRESDLQSLLEKNMR